MIKDHRENSKKVGVGVVGVDPIMTNWMAKNMLQLPLLRLRLLQEEEVGVKEY